MKKFIHLALIVACLSSCISNTEKRGYAFDLADHHLLQEDVTSKESVMRIMGSPTIISELDGQENWLYYSEDVKSFLFFIPKITSRTVFLIKFDDSNTIKSLQKFDLASEKVELKFVSDYTEVTGHKVGFFKSIFSNIGQVKPQ
jgi:outer membrane protein assembly factor BamE (lipoprotein component of BamABCDE complex)